MDVERLLRSDGKVRHVAERVEFDCVVSLYWSSGPYHVAVMVVECAGQEGRIGGSQVRGHWTEVPPPPVAAVPGEAQAVHPTPGLVADD